MNHSFTQSLDGTDRCSRCKYPAVAHGNEAECECCSNIGPVEVRYGNMLMCNGCWEKEQKLSFENMTPEKQQHRVDTMNAAMNMAKELDSRIQVRTDVFNAETTSIVEVKRIIDDNPEITNKPFALGEYLVNRYEIQKKAIFEYNEKIVEASNVQKAIQVYLNTLANSLRAEEREKLKLVTPEYNPSKIKVSKPSAIKTRKPAKLDKSELKKYATELGVAEFTLQMFVVSKGVTVEQAANMIRKSISEAKSESTEVK